MAAIKASLYFTSLFALTTALSLNGCAAINAHRNTVQGASPTPHYTLPLIGVGAASGVVLAAATHSSLVGGGVVGGAVGGAVGLILDSQSSQLKRVHEDGFQVVALGQTIRIIIPSDDCFDPGTSDILESCKPKLKDVAAFLKHYRGAANDSITISAYSDDVPFDEDPTSVTQHQADSIQTFLWVHGIPFERLYTKGYGAEAPIATNYTIKGSALNRRVEIKLQPE